VQVAALSGLNPVTVFSGSHFNYVRLDTGHTRAWGYNSIFMLADGSIESRSSPVAQLGLDAGIVTLDASRHFVCARLPGDHLSCWGYNLYGVFGNGTNDSSLTPLLIPGADEVIGVATGGSFTCALRRDGTIMCTGENTWGQLGDGTTNSRNTFANVVFP
jgi:alpha-tubulin suppressor-like RCC1 family protein